MPPILIVGCILGFLKTMQGRQRLFEVRAMPYGHRVGTHKIRTYPPIAMINVEFFFCGSVGVVFVRKSVHLEDYFFSTIQFQHGFSEPCITKKSIVNIQVSSFPALLLELICSMVFLKTFFLPVPVTVWLALPDVKVLDREDPARTENTSCSLSYHLVRSDRTCSRRCQRPNTTGMLCIVLLAPHLVSRIVQCFQLL